MRRSKNSDELSSKNARTLAKSGAAFGAAAGGRVGPVATGFASGLGGAVGYLAGTAIDAAQADIGQKAAMTDGGQPAGRSDMDTGVTDIPVIEE